MHERVSSQIGKANVKQSEGIQHQDTKRDEKSQNSKGLGSKLKGLLTRQEYDFEVVCLY